MTILLNLDATQISYLHGLCGLFSGLLFWLILIR